MLRLAVTTVAETFERMRAPLAARDVEAVAVEASERIVGLAEPGPTVDVGFVFPPRLMEGGVLDARLDVPWVNDREAILHSRNKGEVLTRLQAAGLPVPDTVVVSDPVDRDDLVEAFERIDGPVLIKPNSATRGTGVARAADLDSFLGICDYLDLVHDYRATGDRSFLVQQFLPDARDYRAMVVDGSYAGAVERRLDDEAIESGRWKHNVHRGAAAEGVSLDQPRRDLVEAVAATLDIAWLGVDLLVTDDGAYVTETNARPTIDSATKYEPGFWDDLAALIRRTADSA
jgi:ribosomal protein S6--L-glutamate ligase